MDELNKRYNLAKKAIDAATRYVDALNDLVELKAERSKLSQPFQDADFAPVSDVQHLDAGMIAVLFDDVVPNLSANFIDVVNGGRNTQILLQIRK